MPSIVGKSKNAVNKFKDKYPDIYQFIIFNILSNIATITNFAVLNLSNSLLFRSFTSVDFQWWIFDYSVANGGLGGFLAFFLSYACAQTVNFFVQRNMVFKSDNKLSKGILLYFGTVAVVYVICMYVPTLLMTPLMRLVGNVWATNIINVVNIMIQVIIIYPMLKFVIMKDADTTDISKV
jgi:putative flippase GtrA